MSRPRFKPLTYKLEKDNNFITKVSTNTTEEKPSVVYLRAKVRITPLEIKKTYEKEILSITNDFKKYAETIFNNNSDYDNNYIFGVDIAEKSVKYKKTSHFRYDVFLKPKKMVLLSEHCVKLKSLSDKLDDKLIKLFKEHNLMWK